MCVCVCACMCVCVFTQWAAARGYSFSNNRQREEGGGGGWKKFLGRGKRKSRVPPPGLRLAEARRPFTAQIFSSSQDCVG